MLAEKQVIGSFFAFNCMLRRYGVEGCWREMSSRAIYRELSGGKVIIAYMGPGYFTNCGHYIVLRDAPDSLSVMVADPNSRARTQMTFDISVIMEQANDYRPFFVCNPPA